MVVSDSNLAAFALAFNLQYSPFRVYTVAQLEEHLRRVPLFVCGRWYRGCHAYVMTGIDGDGTDNGTRVYIDNPSERGPIDFPYGFFLESYQRGPFGLLHY